MVNRDGGGLGGLRLDDSGRDDGNGHEGGGVGDDGDE